MSSNQQELEVKFYVSGLADIETRLQTLGAALIQPRVHEVNLRFDTLNGDLTRTFQVLRLRQDREARITYKGPGVVREGIKARRELECTVGDFETAKILLEALGYVVTVMYEKFRATYAINDVHVTLDEMPYGAFVEIEGPSATAIQAAAETLHLPWEARVLESYIALFEQARQSLGFTFRDLSFANFEGVSVTAQALGIQAVER
jgi:adenylate cyclase class 2